MGHPLTPNQLIQKVIEEDKTEDTVFIIGGGPSLKKYLPDPSVLYGHDVICVNNAYKLFPNALILHYADKVWWSWHQDPNHNVKQNFSGYITTATNQANHHIDRNETRVTCFKNGNKQGGLSDDTTTVNGCNSGHQAINIAIHLQYNQIVLIGFDMHDEKVTHWHNDHKRSTFTGNFAERMIPGFTRLADDLKNYDATIFNLNPDSAIREFPFARLEDFI